MTLKYHDVAETIRQRIAAGTYPVASRLPGEPVLAAELGVSRHTVKSAIRVLEREGVVQCRPAAGTFVVRRAAPPRLIAYMAVNISDPYHAEFIRHLQVAVGAQRASLLVAECSLAPQEDTARFRRLKENGVAGIVYGMPVGAEYGDRLSPDVPVVWMSGDDAIPGQRDTVAIDNATAMVRIVRHLLECGAKTVGYAGGCLPKRYDAMRFRAFRHAVAASPLRTRPEWQWRVPVEGEHGGRVIMDRFLARRWRPDAVVCYNDWNAIGLVRRALERGVAVPGSLKVTGFDNIFVSQYFQVPLTTIDLDIAGLAGAAATVLFARLANPGRAPQRMVEQSQLVVRQSTRADT
jgi:DNA-binding LacI/PurR family transcriptional regulator